MIPIYRAKKIDSDEYVEGHLFKYNSNEDVYIMSAEFVPLLNVEDEEHWQIDPLTLAIHFPDIIDSEGTKIFASLSKDGKGGDNVDLGYNFIKRTMIMGKSIFQYNYEKSKVTGIQE